MIEIREFLLTPFRPGYLWTLCPEVRDRAFHLVPPHVPAGRGLSGKQLHPGHIAHEGHDLFTGLLRLAAVFLYGGDNKLVDVGRLPFRMSPRRQQAHLRVAPCPKT